MIRTLLYRLRSDSVFRFRLSFLTSLTTTTIFAFFNAWFGYTLSSAWYGSIALYFILLAIQRFYMYFYGKKIANNSFLTPSQRATKEVRFSIFNGFLLLCLVIGLSFSILQIMTAKKPMIAGKILAIATAAYAFSKLTLASFHFVKEIKHKVCLTQTIRIINFIDALVSLLSLTVTLLTTFGTIENFRSLLFLVSSSIALLITCIAVGMIISGLKKIQKMKIEKNHLLTNEKI